VIANESIEVSHRSTIFEKKLKSMETKKANLIHKGITKLGVCNYCELGKLILEGLMLGLGSSPHHLCDSGVGPVHLWCFLIILSGSIIRGLRNLLLQPNERDRHQNHCL
jgi:hypothetical protein